MFSFNIFRLEFKLRTITNLFQDNQPKTPEFPVIKELKDLSDGVGLAALVSFYCPEEVPWKDVTVSYLPTVSDSVKNLMLVHDFCQRCLPHTVFHLMPEDISYLRR